MWGDNQESGHLHNTSGYYICVYIYVPTIMLPFNQPLVYYVAIQLVNSYYPQVNKKTKEKVGMCQI